MAILPLETKLRMPAKDADDQDVANTTHRGGQLGLTPPDIAGHGGVISIS